MKKTLVSTVAAALIVAFTGMVSADEISGRLAEINAEAQTFTLENGMTFSISEDVNLEGLAAGQEVRVTFEKKDSKNTATEVGRPQN